MTGLSRLSEALAARYEIEHEVGRGGMATVFVARDLRHARKVAVKVLDPDLGAVLGAERFLSEIRVTANLQHPNLLPLFDSGEADGLLFYVMPFVEGETLRHRLAREKQLPVDEAVRIAVSIANALEYAHGHGVIHRDLKPENILLQAGQPVVADFGIALAVSNAGGTRVTQTGLSLGTPQYMSPEQATGDRAIDGRTDVYSLAAMTYEMLGGEAPHTGTTAQAIIAKLMTTDPQPLRVLRPTAPPNVAAAVEAGLAKLPADRLPSARAFADALTNPAFGQSATISSASAMQHGRRSRDRLTLGAAAAVAVIASCLGGWALLRPKPHPQLVRYELITDSASAVAEGGRWGRIALSPDGTTLAYIGGPKNSIYLRRANALESTPLAGTDESRGPAFSPDGKRLAFFRPTPNGGGILYVVGVDGSAPITVTDSLVGSAGVTWVNDTLLYADGAGATPLVRVAARGGAKPVVLNVLDTAMGQIDAVYPWALPNHAGVLFSSAGQRKGEERKLFIWVTEGLGPRSHIVVDNALRAAFIPPNHLLYVTIDGKLMTAPFDLRALRVTGEPVLVADGLPRAQVAMDLATSATGRLAYIAGVAGVNMEFVWADRSGKPVVVDSSWRGGLSSPALSPDGSQLAINSTLSGSGTDIWIKRLTDGAMSRLTLEGGQNSLPVWSPDGKTLYHVRTTADGSSIVRRPADGSAPPTPIVRSQHGLRSFTISPDGQWVVFEEGDAAKSRLYRQRIGDSSAARIVPGDAPQRTPAISPDGRWLAYVANEAGLNYVYVAPFDKPATTRWLVSRRQGTLPAWSHRGTELYYRELDSMAVVPVTSGATFSFGTPRALFPLTRYDAPNGAHGYDISRDDSRFLLLRTAGQSRTRLVMVENWTEEVRP